MPNFLSKLGLTNNNTPRKIYVGTEDHQYKVKFKKGGSLGTVGTTGTTSEGIKGTDTWAQSGNSIFFQGAENIKVKYKGKGESNVAFLDCKNIDYKSKAGVNKLNLQDTDNANIKLKKVIDGKINVDNGNLINADVDSRNNYIGSTEINFNGGIVNNLKATGNNTTYINNTSDYSNITTKSGTTVINSDSNFSTINTSIKGPATTYLNVSGEHNQLRVDGNSADIINNVGIQGDYNTVEVPVNDKLKLNNNGNKTTIVN